MSERKEFQPLAKGAKETCSYPCGNLEHDHYYEIEDILENYWDYESSVPESIDYDLARDIEGANK